MSFFADLFGISDSRRSAERAAADALAQQKLTDAAAERNRIAMENMQRNFATTLGVEKQAVVIAGGTADLATENADLLRKKQSTASSTQLGGVANALGLTV